MSDVVWAIVDSDKISCILQRGTQTITHTDFESYSAHRTRNRVPPFQLGRLLESLFIARLLKSEDALSEAMVQSMSFLVGSDEAMHLV